MNPLGKLQIAKGVFLPLDTVTQTVGLLAKKGKGKTYTFSVIAEEMQKAGLQVVIADVVGVCWGLRASADGAGPGLPFLVLGGDHGDVPLHPDQGALIADVVIESGQCFILDLSDMSGGEMVRFMADFCNTLYRKNRRPMHLMLDEADAFAPQKPMPGETVMLGAVDKIVRRGRAKGIGITLATQRPAVINKNVLTQIELMILLGMSAPQDLAAVDAWVKVHGTPEQRKELMDSLPSLNPGKKSRGEAWLWSPSWLEIFQRVQIRQRDTFDSSKTPELGETLIQPQDLAPVDLESLRTRMATAVEERKENDPKALKAQIKELESQLANAHPAPDAHAIDTAIDEATTPLVRRIDGLETIVGEAADITERLLNVLRNTAEAGTLVRAITRMPEPPTSEPLRDSASPRDTSERPTGPTRPTGLTGSADVSSAPEPVPSTEKPSGAKYPPQLPQRILNAIATWNMLGLARPTRQLVAFQVNLVESTKSFRYAVITLKDEGLVHVFAGDLLALTEHGKTRAEVVQAQSLESYHQMWMQKLRNVSTRLNRLDKAPEIFQMLIEAHPRGLTRQAIGDRLGLALSTKSLRYGISVLRDFELMQGPFDGPFVLTGRAMPEGLK